MADMALRHSASSSSSTASAPVGHQSAFAIDAARNRFPFCIVWGPLPCISWFLPFIGHMGVCDSKGRVHDFAGPYTIGVDRFMVGDVTKYVQIDPTSMQPDFAALHEMSDASSSSAAAASSTDTDGLSPDAVRRWDEAVISSDKEYAQQMHNICCNNCHHHSAAALQNAGLPMTMFSAWVLITFRGRWVSSGAWLKTHLPFLLIVGIILFATLFKVK